MRSLREATISWTTVRRVLPVPFSLRPEAIHRGGTKNVANHSPTIRCALLGLILLATPSPHTGFAQPLERSWHYLTTGNGHGFQVFDRTVGRLTDFLEHPYHFVAPLDGRRDGGVARRDLAHDIYFGVRLNDNAQWLTELTEVRYEKETHVIRGQASIGSVPIHVRYFAPFGYDGNGVVMMANITNTTDSPMDVSVVAKANLKLGLGRSQPGDDSEEISWQGTYGTETGPGGGHMVYWPLGETSIISCGRDSDVYEGFLSGQLIMDRPVCEGDDQVLLLGNQTVLEPGASLWWGQAILFVNDNPADPQARDFRDDRSVADVVNQWQTFAGDLDAEGLHRQAMTEFESWRVPPSTLGLPELTPEETRIWRQSETVLRMGQVMEPTQINRRNRGMFLAALPTGEWHIGWVRDGAYAIIAQAMNGHHTEARLGIEFFLNAWAGFFSQPEYLGRSYRVSSVRYYGNGKEEGDFNGFGPNVETDGFGLVLWAARAYLHYSCDTAWLDSETLHGDTVFDALTQIARDIDALIIDDLPMAECSIWEVHWAHRKVFTYTAATAIRGLYDFAAIADLADRPGLAALYRERAQRILARALDVLVNQPTQSLASSREVAETDVFVDGSTIEMLHWGLIEPNSPIFNGTLAAFERLLTQSGGYRRLEPNLSVNGEPQAGTYDLSEWIVLDLRIGDVFRRVGLADRAQDLLDRVTNAALVNDGLIPELFEPNEYGRYAGAIPMVGYGAGVWQMSQLEKAGLGAPGIDAGWQHCPDRNVGNGSHGDGGHAEVSTDGSTPTNRSDMSISNMDASVPDEGPLNGGQPDTDSAFSAETGSSSAPNQSNSKSLCATHSGHGSPFHLFLLLLILHWAITRLRGRDNRSWKTESSPKHPV